MARGKPGGGAKKNDDDKDDANDNRRCRRRRNRHPLTTDGGDDGGDDDDDDDAKFRNALLDEGRIISEMKADGNCLFRSLSDQLYGDRGARHDVVRREICEYLSKNGKEFENFLLLDDDDKDVLGMEGYVGRMRKVRMHTCEGSRRNPFILFESKNIIFILFFSHSSLPPPPHSSSSSSSSADEKKHTQDGQWGGNVEVVVASKLHGRSIIVFSSEYSNGALSIAYDDDGDIDGGGGCAARGDRLLLSYHGNDHYNSVRSIQACPSSLGGTIDDRRGGEGQRRSSKKSSGGNGEGGAADDANKDSARGSDDGMEGAKASQSTTGGRRSDRRIDGNEGRRRPPARGSVCPCGSGKKYKKCCSARDKIETRRSTRLLRDGITPNEDGSARESDCDKDKERDGAEEFIGSFKVLAI